MPSQSTEREKISTSACHFWRPGRQRCRCLRYLLSVGERCSCMVQSLTYLGGQRQHVWRIKWRLESRHLIENTSRGPNVCLLTVRLALDNFRTNRNEIRTLNTDVKREKGPYLTVNAFSTKVLLNWGHEIFSYWRQDRHCTWSSEPREGLPVYRAKEYLYFMTLSIGPAPGIEPATSPVLCRLSLSCRGQ